jgi:hypothetical protein
MRISNGNVPCLKWQIFGDEAIFSRPNLSITDWNSIVESARKLVSEIYNRLGN